MIDPRYIFRKKPSTCCQFVYCVKAWTKHIQSKGSPTWQAWELRLCDEHAQRYADGFYRSGKLRMSVTITDRKNLLASQGNLGVGSSKQQSVECEPR